MGCLWKCRLDRLQLRLVLLRGKHAVRAEPEQGTGLGWERNGAWDCQEWSLVNLWMLERQTLCSCNPLLLAFSQQGSGWTNNHKSKLKKNITLLQQMLQKGEKYFTLLHIQKIFEHLI